MPWVYMIWSRPAGLAGLAGCRPLPPSKPASEWTPQEARGAAVYEAKCARCHYPTNSHPLHGPGLQALTKLKAMPSGAPPTDERLTAVILHGRGDDARHTAHRQPARRPARLLAHAMTETFKTIPPGTGRPPVRNLPKSQKPKLLHLPGLVAISLYMLLLALVVIMYVAKGHFPPLCLVFPVFFIAAGLGLLKLFRWAWTLTLAAVAMLSGLFFWNYTTQHQLASLMQGLVNLVIFLYLVRADIRNKLH